VVLPTGFEPVSSAVFKPETVLERPE